MIAAISITGSTSRIASERLEEYREIVGRVAGLVSSELTHSQCFGYGSVSKRS